MQRAIGKRRKTLIYLAAIIPAAAVFAGDFFLKKYFRLNHPFESLPVITNIFHFSVVFNKGAAFGIFQGQTPFLIGMSVILVILFFTCFHREEDRSIFNAIAYGLVLGGALSNLFDRVTLGYVVDYLDFRVWPVFNLSDTCICTGVGLLIIKSFKAKPADGTRV